jgi:uncharacterized protein YecE (DUF72 family)
MTYHLGTSGWSYPGWRERFYPAGLSSKDWLEFYASTLSPDYRNVIEFRHESWYEDRDCYIYFNNDYKAYAVANCRRLAALLEDES